MEYLIPIALIAALVYVLYHQQNSPNMHDAGTDMGEPSPTPSREYHIGDPGDEIPS